MTRDQKTFRKRLCKATICMILRQLFKRKINIAFQLMNNYDILVLAHKK